MANSPLPIPKSQLELQQQLISKFPTLVSARDRRMAALPLRAIPKTQHELHTQLAAFNITPEERFTATSSVPDVVSKSGGAAGPGGLMGGLVKLAGKINSNVVGRGVFKALDLAVLKPLMVADTGRRAVISVLRETVDALDDDSKTKASFSDFMRGTKDYSTGFGTTFDLTKHKWRGRIIGFLGDVLLDPLTYATIGAAVPAKAVVKSLSTGGQQVLTRSLIGKSMHGARGRQMLADVTYDRLKHFQKIGTKLDGQLITDAKIGQVVKDVAFKGKQKLPGLVREDIGVRGPGIYYFGSRVKFPASEPVAWMLEKGLTGVRTTLVKPRYVKVGGQMKQLSPTAGLYSKLVPTGQARIAQFGPDGIYNARLKLSNGTATPTEAPFLLETIKAFEFSRGRVSAQIENAANMFSAHVSNPAAAPFAKTVYSLLEGVRSAGPKTSSVEVQYAADIRKVFNYLSDLVDAEFKKVDSGWVNRFVRNYFPRIRTPEFVEWMEANPQLVQKLNLNNLTVDMLDQFRLAKSAKSRVLDVDEPWFGTTLTKADLNIDSLNRIAAPITGGIPVFQTDINVVTAAYARRYGEHIGMASMLQHMKNKGPEYLAEWHKAVPPTLTGVAPAAGVSPAKLRAVTSSLTAQVSSKPVRSRRVVSTTKPVGATSKSVVAPNTNLTAVVRANTDSLDDAQAIYDSVASQHDDFVSLSEDFLSDLTNEDGLGAAHLMMADTEGFLTNSLTNLTESLDDAKALVTNLPAHASGAVDRALIRFHELLDAHKQNVEFALNRIVDAEEVSDVAPKVLDSMGTTMSSRNMDVAPKPIAVRNVPDMSTVEGVGKYLDTISPLGLVDESVSARPMFASLDELRVAHRNVFDSLFKIVSAMNPKFADDFAKGKLTTYMGELFERQRRIRWEYLKNKDTGKDILDNVSGPFAIFQSWVGFKEIVGILRQMNMPYNSDPSYGISLYIQLAQERNSVLERLASVPKYVEGDEALVARVDSSEPARMLQRADLLKRVELEVELLDELIAADPLPSLQKDKLRLKIADGLRLAEELLTPNVDSVIYQNVAFDSRVVHPERRMLEFYLDALDTRMTPFERKASSVVGAPKVADDAMVYNPTIEEMRRIGYDPDPTMPFPAPLKVVSLVDEEFSAMGRAIESATKNLSPYIKKALDDYRVRLIKDLRYSEEMARRFQRSAKEVDDVIFALEKRVEALQEVLETANYIDNRGVFVPDSGVAVTLENATNEAYKALGIEDIDALDYINRRASMRAVGGGEYDEDLIPFGTGANQIIVRDLRNDANDLRQKALAHLTRVSNLNHRLEKNFIKSFINSDEGRRLINASLRESDDIVPSISAKAEILEASEVFDIVFVEEISGHSVPDQQIVNLMLDDDFYPFAKGDETTLNLLYELANFDFSKFVPRTPMPDIGVWYTPGLEQFLGTRPSVTPSAGAVMVAVRENFYTLRRDFGNWLKQSVVLNQILSPEELKLLEVDGFSNQYLLLKFKFWLTANYPEILAPKDVRSTIQEFIENAWIGSDSRKFLSKIEMHKKAVLDSVAQRSPKSSLDSYVFTESTKAAARERLQRVKQPWRRKDTSDFYNAWDRLTGFGVNLKKSMRRQVESKIVRQGDTLFDDQEEKRAMLILRSIEDGSLKVPGIHRMLARRKLQKMQQTPATVAEMVTKLPNGDIVDADSGDLLLRTGDSSVDESTLSNLSDSDVSDGLAPMSGDEVLGGSDDEVLGGSERAYEGSIREEVASGEMGTLSTEDLELQLIANYINGIESKTYDLLLQHDADVRYLSGVLNSPMDTKSVEQIKYELEFIQKYTTRHSDIKKDREYALIDLSIERRLFEDNGFDIRGARRLRERRLLELGVDAPYIVKGKRGDVVRFVFDAEDAVATKAAVATQQKASKAARAKAAKEAKLAVEAAKQESELISKYGQRMQAVFRVFARMEETFLYLLGPSSDGSSVKYWGLSGDDFGSKTPILTGKQRETILRMYTNLKRQRTNILSGKKGYSNLSSHENFEENVEKLASWVQTIENRLAFVADKKFGAQVVDKPRPDVADYGWSKELRAQYNVEGDLIPEASDVGYPKWRVRTPWYPFSGDTAPKPLASISDFPQPPEGVLKPFASLPDLEDFRIEPYQLPDAPTPALSGLPILDGQHGAESVLRGYSSKGMSKQPSIDEVQNVIAELRKFKSVMNQEQSDSFFRANLELEEVFGKILGDLVRGRPVSPENLILLDHTHGVLQQLRLTANMSPQAAEDALAAGTISAIDGLAPPIRVDDVPASVGGPRVWNKRGPDTPLDAVYIGRPGKWGNPFIIGKDGDRATVILKFEEYLRNSPKLLDELSELRGKDLACWCAPNACHGDVLIKLVDEFFPSISSSGVDTVTGEIVDRAAFDAATAAPTPAVATPDYAGGYANIGKGTPNGDGKDVAMRKVADSSIVELFDNKPSSSRTSLDTLGPVNENSKIIMLARNSEFKNQPLKEITVTQIKNAHARGAKFIVGDMPNVDSKFVDLLDEIGADYTIYHTGNTSRIVKSKTLPPVTVVPTPAPATVVPTPAKPVASGSGGKPPTGGKPRLSPGGPVPGRTPRAVMAAGMIEMEGMFPNLWMNPVIHEMWENVGVFEAPEYAKHLRETIGQYTAFHKIYSTATPGFHVRNGIANMVQLIVSGVNPININNATKIYYKWVIARGKGVSYGDFLSTLPAVERNYASIARNALHLSGGGIFTESFHTTYKGGRLLDNRFTQKTLRLGRESDDYSRFVMGYDSAVRGEGSTVGAARIQRWFFDYEDISKLDAAMKEIVPFWLWTSRNLVLHLQNMWLDPRPYQIYGHFVRNVRDDEGYPPPFVDEVGGYKLPFGNNLYATPDVNFNRVDQQIGEIRSGTGYGQNLNPIFRVPLEQALGRNLYNDKSLEGFGDRSTHVLQGLLPPLKYADRLFGTEGEQQRNAFLSFLGSPVKQYGGE